MSGWPFATRGAWVGILVGYVEEIEVDPHPSSTGRFTITLRHRDPTGRLYAVSVQARRLVSHNLPTTPGRGAENRLFRFPKMELAAFMDGEVLRVCRRDDIVMFLRRAQEKGSASHPDEHQLL